MIDREEREYPPTHMTLTILLSMDGCRNIRTCFMQIGYDEDVRSQTEIIAQPILNSPFFPVLSSHPPAFGTNLK